MSSLAQIEREIEKLPADDLARFRKWFAAYDARRFDERIASDAGSCRRDSMVDKALRDFRGGRSEPL